LLKLFYDIGQLIKQTLRVTRTISHTHRIVFTIKTGT